MSTSQHATDAAVCEAQQCLDSEQLALRSQKIQYVSSLPLTKLDTFPQQFHSESLWMKNPSSKEEKLVLICLHLPF